MCKELYNKVVDGESISLHIRRGDYTVNPNHPTQTVEYYDKALSNFDSKIPVFDFQMTHLGVINRNYFLMIDF